MENILRNKYLARIRPYYESNLIKAITGVRRCGKSVILSQIIDEIRNSVDSAHIIIIDLESIEGRKINTCEKLENKISNLIKDKDKYYIFIDEIYLLFQYEYSANFLFTLWKRVRKYGAFCTGITQNVEDLLQSHTARTMLANSEFIIMLNQASTDRIELAKLLNISDLQMSFITNVGAGEGLIKVGSSLVPFVNKFPKNTELYRLMTTKFGEN